MAREADAASFRTSADAYDRHVGRYGRSLARGLIETAGLPGDARVLDVGCGPGALTMALAEVVGPARVAAVEPSEPFAAACRARVPGADVRVATAERIPFDDDSFDATLSQLVVNFLPDAAAGAAEMRRVTRPGGTVCACVWDYADGMTLLRAFWDAAVALDPERAAPLDEGRRMPHCRPGELERLWVEAGLLEVTVGPVVAVAAYDGFEDLWEPLPLGVGPSGAYCAALSEAGRDALREELRRRLGSPAGPFELSARAWAVRGTVPG
ncbi:MAG TPA: methyltransferase domain-containing protein [Thermoleophilaceae bacterium]